MTDLRQSVHQVVQDAVDFASDASLEENTREGNECTDAVLSIFAAWLRERADRADDPPATTALGSVGVQVEAAALRRLADGIDHRGYWPDA